jgi:hypothetical protein
MCGHRVLFYCRNLVAINLLHGLKKSVENYPVRGNGTVGNWMTDKLQSRHLLVARHATNFQTYWRVRSPANSG